MFSAWQSPGAPKTLQGGGSTQLYYHDCSGRIPGHTTRAPPVGFELETNGFLFYAIANLDKTSLQHPRPTINKFKLSSLGTLSLSG